MQNNHFKITKALAPFFVGIWAAVFSQGVFEAHFDTNMLKFLVDASIYFCFIFFFELSFPLGDFIYDRRKKKIEAWKSILDFFESERCTRYVFSLSVFGMFLFIFILAGYILK